MTRPTETAQDASIVPQNEIAGQESRVSRVGELRRPRADPGEDSARGQAESKVKRGRGRDPEAVLCFLSMAPDGEFLKIHKNRHQGQRHQRQPTRLNP